jgi:hypothetical protein
MGASGQFGVVILATGPAGPRKTEPAFHLPGPLFAITGNDGLRPYAGRYEFNLAAAEGIADAVHLFDAIEEMPEEDRPATVLVQGAGAWQGVNVPVDPDWQVFVRHVRRLAQMGIHVWISMHGHRETGERLPGPNLDAIHGRVGYAMDVVFHVDEDTGRAEVLRSRVPQFPYGVFVDDFGAAVARYVEAGLTASPSE